MSDVRCKRGHAMVMTSPDYGRGSEWTCYTCDVYGAREIRTDGAARAASDSARATSAANARARYAPEPNEPEPEREGA